MSDLVGNPKDRFSRLAAQIIFWLEVYSKLTVNKNSLVIVSSPRVVNPICVPVSLDRNKFTCKVKRQASVQV